MPNITCHLCDLVFHADAEALLVDFIHQYPEVRIIKQLILI